MLNKKIIALALIGIISMSFSFPENIVDKAHTLYQNFTKVTWSMLGKISFSKKKDPKYGEVMYPVINESLKKLQGKKIKAEGFIVPIDNKTYALSKNVFAQCFFCGNAGPETIMGIKFKGTTPRLKTDLYVTIEGTFRYNDKNVDDWIYHIENAVITSSK